MRDGLQTASGTRSAIAIVIAHAAAVALHSAAHLILDVQASSSQTVFIVVVIMAAPLVAGLMLWRRIKRAGALLLASSMTGALAFGVYNHFIASSPDHVSHVSQMSPQSWALVFQATAVLLALTEALGVGSGMSILLRSRER